MTSSQLIEKLKSHFRQIFDTEASGQLILFSPLVGIVAGLGAAAFFYLLNKTQELALRHIEGYWPPPAGSEPAPYAPQMPSGWWQLGAVVLVPAVGGLLCGLLVYGFVPRRKDTERTRWCGRFTVWVARYELACRW